MRKYNIIFVVFAVSILVLGWELYDTIQKLNNLDSSLKNSITLKTFNFTMVLSDTTQSKHFSEQESGLQFEWGDVAVLENVTLTSVSGKANMSYTSDVLTGSRPLDVCGLGFPFSKRWISHSPPPPDYVGDSSDYYHTTVKVNTLGYSFNEAVMNTTELTPYENQTGYTIAITYYTFTGQVDLLYPTILENVTFYLTLHPDQQFSTLTSNWYKTASLPQA